MPRNSEIGELLRKWLYRQVYGTYFTSHHLWRNVLGYACTRPTVYYHMMAMRDEGLIEKETGGGRGRNVRWRVLVNKGKEYEL